MPQHVPYPDTDDDTVLSRYIFVNDGAPTDGTSGTFAGTIPAGGLLIDKANTNLYINTNTKASPTYTLVGTQA